MPEKIRTQTAAWLHFREISTFMPLWDFCGGVHVSALNTFSVSKQLLMSGPQFSCHLNKRRYFFIFFFFFSLWPILLQEATESCLKYVTSETSDKILTVILQHISSNTRRWTGTEQEHHLLSSPWYSSIRRQFLKSYLVSCPGPLPNPPLWTSCTLCQSSTEGTNALLLVPDLATDSECRMQKLDWTIMHKTQKNWAFLSTSCCNAFRNADELCPKEKITEEMI